MIRTAEDVITLKSRVIAWWCHRRTPCHPLAHLCVTTAVGYLDDAAEAIGSRRTHFLRCARDQWRVAVRLTAEGA